MNLPEGSSLTYVIAHEAWYAQVGERKLVDRPQIQIGAAVADSSVHWEFVVEEVELGKPQPAIRVKIFDDAFAAIGQVPEFFTALAAEHPTTLAEIVKLLDRLGARDVTTRQAPAPVYP